MESVVRRGEGGVKCWWGTLRKVLRSSASHAGLIGFLNKLTEAWRWRVRCGGRRLPVGWAQKDACKQKQDRVQQERRAAEEELCEKQASYS